ncbi:MAG: sigma 54-interacting transcriptional regulator [Opitutaceae bacterium]|jgi:transcriptional regulator with PAS, ATPase and Fis domain
MKTVRMRSRSSGEQSDPSLLYGRSEAIRRVVRLAKDVADTDVTVLIEGESGTGKELVARTIHEHSRRATKPFIFVNCAALPEHLVESELFGYVKGAFTDARADKPGRFLLADGGTLFLDEIGDLSPKGQGDLLRVLEDRAFRMIGGTEMVNVDVRIIAATNRNLRKEVAAGKFREDLFYRLQIVPILTPPLRERGEDIPVLIETFLAHFRSKHGRGPARMSAGALLACQRFPWPGNVRELRNLIERLVVTCRAAEITEADLPEFIGEHERTAAEFTVRVGMTLAEAERLLIKKTLEQATAHRAKAASLLGISRRALQYKLKAYGLLEVAEADDGAGPAQDNQDVCKVCTEGAVVD